MKLTVFPEVKTSRWVGIDSSIDEMGSVNAMTLVISLDRKSHHLQEVGYTRLEKEVAAYLLHLSRLPLRLLQCALRPKPRF